ncbi:anoctamin-4-like [Choristoneura fumiferana]|uniref:anoctamin-4-like n=1 Tax=Choristoneura fumiferana TaxID=7141 RepID=UPI003D153657
MTLCNPVGCSDELALSLCVTVILKECFVKMLWNFYYFITLRTDYNQGILLNMDVPCWEREYRLPTVKDDFIHDKMKSLVVQFVLTIVFICGCPFTPIFAIFVNIFDIRNSAHRLVKGFRRPLLMGYQGIGSWKYMFYVLIVLAFLVNTLIVVITTSKFRFNVDSSIYKRRMPFYIFQENGTLPQKINDEIITLENKGYQHLSYNTCFYTAGYITVPLNVEGEKPATPNLSILSFRIYLSSEYYSNMMVLTTCLITFLYFIIPSRLRDVEETRAREKDIIKQSRYVRGRP